MYDLATPTNAMRELSLFSGAGGGLLATTHLLKWRTVCYVEWDAYCIQVLKQRIADGYLHDAPIWDDVQTFDGAPWRGCVDIVTAGFPCQPFSTAGKRNGSNDDRNMWPATIRIIREVRPAWVLLENVPGLLSAMDDTATLPHSYAGTVLGDLAESGYDARWRVLSAAEVGAPHKRDRIFIVASYACGDGLAQAQQPRTNRTQEQRRVSLRTRTPGLCEDRRSDRWLTYTDVQRTGDGVAHRVDRLKAIGNGQVPAVVSTVWRLLTETD